jgi:CelD/BcsL family acetyltransferase involved in cellulose biosynthesis
MTLTIQSESFDQLEREWDNLLGRSAVNTPFNTFSWNRTWWEVYGEGELWLITCRDRENVLLGIAPFFIETTSHGERVVRFVGHIDVVDYMDLIIDKDYRDSVFADLAAYLAQSQKHFDAIGLANIQETSPTYEGLPAALRDVGFKTGLEHIEVAPQIELPSTYDDYLKDILDSRERKETKRKMRKAEGGLYDVAWYTVGAEHNLEKELQQFLELMRSADEGKAAFLENPKNVEFFSKVMPLVFDAGYLQLMFITIDGTACAAYLNFDYGDHVYVYNSGLEPAQFGALSPGIVLLQYAIQHSIDQDRRIFDFLRGDETYKYKMGGRDKRLFQINATC